MGFIRLILTHNKCPRLNSAQYKFFSLILVHIESAIRRICLVFNRI